MERTENRSELLEQALGGSRQAFELITEPHRRELQVHCYRMLGSILDAEDMVQETLVRAWEKLHTFEGRAPLRAWLYRIATNVSLDELAKRSKRSLPQELYPAADPMRPLSPAIMDPIWIEPFPDAWLEPASTDPAARYDQRESVTLAFIVALQSLPPRQRAILLLRDVLGLRSKEVADLLDLSTSAIESALYRARRTLSNRYSSPTPAALASDPMLQDLLDRYVNAWEAADIEGLVALMREDATFPMPPSPTWVKGREQIRRFVTENILEGDARGRWKLLQTQANGQPAFAWYRRNPNGSTYAPFAIQVVSIDGGLVSDATTFVLPQLFAAFELPLEIERPAQVKRKASWR